MSQVTGGIIGFLVVAALAHIGQFYICSSTLPTTDEDPGSTFDNVQALASWDACDGNGVFQFAMFVVFTLPILLILASYLFVFAPNAIVGSIIAALLVVVGLIGIFS